MGSEGLLKGSKDLQGTESRPGLQALAKEVACYLGMDLSPIKIKRFADGEVYVAVEVSPPLPPPRALPPLLLPHSALNYRHSSQGQELFLFNLQRHTSVKVGILLTNSLAI